MASVAKRVRPEEIKIPAAQLELIPTNHNPFWQSTLFNEVYLQNDVPVKYKEKWELEESGTFAQFCTDFVDLCSDLSKEDPNSWSERTTINRFIKPILKMLGYTDLCSTHQEPWAEDESFSVQENGELKTYKPDFVVVNDPAELKFIEKKKGEDKVDEARRTSILSIEAKYWNRIEERRRSEAENSKRADKRANADSTRGLDFDDQCLKYMEITHKDYGILTDGSTWRLYNRELSAGSFKRNFQFNLGKLMKHVNAGLDRNTHDYRFFLDNAKYFFHIFSKESLFGTEGERRFVDDLTEYSKKYASKVEEDLKDRFLRSMTLTCNALDRGTRAAGHKIEPSIIRNLSESFLFNVLFIRYCESRGILPLKQSPEYRKQSLSNILDKLELYDPERESENLNHTLLTRMFSKDFSYDPKGNELHDRFVKLTKIIQDGSGSEFKGFEIAGFKESVFSKDEWKIVQSSKLTNAEMIQIFFELGYTKSTLKGKKFQQIPFNFFSPRQLGSIYESFLEFRIERATEDMAYIKKQWQPANIKSEKIRNLDVPVVGKGQLFFSPDNKDRKATGSYYTPDYVVQYIVDKAVAPLLKKASSADLLKLRICDPAMGSGHFLNGCLNYLAARYLEKLERETNDDLTLTLADAKRLVLHNCVFGVDLNPRAVKLAKMSLWLESAHEGHGLEDLDDQLFCGDSISGSFDWKKQFSSVFKAAGFDAIVGNPPYRKERESKELMEAIKSSAYGQKYYEGKMDLWYFFLHRALDIVKPNHKIGFIVPTYWTKSAGSSKLIARLRTEATFVDVVDFKKNKIFQDVSGQHMVFVVENGKFDSKFSFQNFQVNGFSEDEMIKRLGSNSPEAPISVVAQESIFTDEGCLDFDASKFEDILDTMNSNTFKLEDSSQVFKVSQGIVEAPDRITHEMAKKAKKPSLGGRGVFVLDRRELNSLGLNQQEKAFVRKYLRGEDVSRFKTEFNDMFVLYLGNKDNKEVLSNKSKYPNLVKHFKEVEYFVTSSNKPFGLHRARESEYFTGEKLLCHNMFDKPSFAFSEEEIYVNFAFNVIIKGPKSEYSLQYLLGLFNSKMGEFWFNRKGKKRGVNNDVGVGVIREFPIPKLDLKSKKERAQYDAVIDAVKNLEKLRDKLALDDRKVVVAQEKLDTLVFKLYKIDSSMETRILEAGSLPMIEEEEEAA